MSTKIKMIQKFAKILVRHCKFLHWFLDVDMSNFLKINDFPSIYFCICSAMGQ